MTDTTKQLSFVVDSDTLDLIEKLKKELGVKSAAAVFRRSLALAKIAAEQAKDSDGIVSLRGRKQAAADEISVALNA